MTMASKLISKKLIVMLLIMTALTVAAHAAEPEVFQSDIAVTVTEISPIISQDSLGILPQSIQIRPELGVDLLVKAFEVSSDIVPDQLVEQSLERGGIEYTLREILRDARASTASSRQEFQTVTISSESDKREDILPLLLRQIEYNSGGYSGWLQLDESSITTEVESMRDSSRNISETRVFPSLARNDPHLIPRSIEHNGITLQLADIQWDSGNPNEHSPMFTTTATYTGKARSQTPDGFLVTAKYAGHVAREVPGNIVYTLVYEPLPPPEIVCEDESGGFNFGLIVRIILAAFGVGGLVELAIILPDKLPLFKGRQRKNRRVKHISLDDELQTRPARRKPHALGYMKRDSCEKNV